MENALEDLDREEVIFRTTMEEEEDKYDKEAKMLEEKINNQMKLLEKELNKLKNINHQNHAGAVKELNAYKQSLLR